jgi:ABC-type nitrate/sulfonate/bicarbonate transport system ATPase subunit
MCYPVVYTNILSGLDNMDKEQLEMVRMYQVRGGAVLRHLYIPSVMPEITASLNLIAGLSWKTVVTAEIFAVPGYSMGYNLLMAKSYLETGRLFAWIIAIIALSLLFEKSIQKALLIFTRKGYEGSRLIKVKAAPGPAKNTGATPVIQAEGVHQQADIELKMVYKSFGEKAVLNGVDATFKHGKVTALMGASGIGKTTLLRAIAGLGPCDSGEIKGIESRRISFLFQENRLLPWLNIYDNIALVLKGRLPSSDIDKGIRKILEPLSLTECTHKLPAELSGGMKRRAALARAFLYPGDTLLLDEPFKGLDQALKNRVAPMLFSEYATEKTVILVTHEPEDADKYADDVVLLNKCPVP